MSETIAPVEGTFAESRYAPIPDSMSFLTSIQCSRNPRGVIRFRLLCTCDRKKVQSYDSSWLAYEGLVAHARGHEAGLSR